MYIKLGLRLTYYLATHNHIATYHIIIQSIDDSYNTVQQHTVPAQFKLDNETSVALELFTKFVGPLMSFTQAYDPMS